MNLARVSESPPVAEHSTAAGNARFAPGTAPVSCQCNKFKSQVQTTAANSLRGVRLFSRHPPPLVAWLPAPFEGRQIRSPKP